MAKGADKTPRCQGAKVGPKKYVLTLEHVLEHQLEHLFSHWRAMVYRDSMIGVH